MRIILIAGLVFLLPALPGCSDSSGGPENAAEASQAHFSGESDLDYGNYSYDASQSYEAGNYDRDEAERAVDQEMLRERIRSFR